MPDIPKPDPGPKAQTDDAPLAHDKTPSSFVNIRDFPVTAAFVDRKLQQRDQDRGKPVMPKKLTPWFLAGFTLCGSVTTVAMSFEGTVPRPVLVLAAIGSMFFGAMLGIGPGLRK